MNYNSLELHFTSRTRHVIDTLHKFLLNGSIIYSAVLRIIPIMFTNAIHQTV